MTRRRSRAHSSSVRPRSASLLPSQPNESLIGGLTCLEAVVAAGRPIGTRELSRLLDMNHTRVSRLVKTLAHLGLLSRTQEGRYRSGPGIHVLAALSLQGSFLLRSAMPEARRWWSRGYAVTVGVLWKNSVCHLLYARPEKPFDQAIAGHELSPASWSTAGLVLLAARPAEETRDLVLPTRPIWADPDEPLARILSGIRRSGYAIRRYADGTVSLGVRVGNPPFAGFAVSQKGMTDPEILQTVEALHETANLISRETSAGGE